MSLLYDQTFSIYSTDNEYYFNNDYMNDNGNCLLSPKSFTDEVDMGKLIDAFNPIDIKKEESTNFDSWSQEPNSGEIIIPEVEEDLENDFTQKENNDDTITDAKSESSFNIFDHEIKEEIIKKKEKPSDRKIADDSIRKKFKTLCEEKTKAILNISISNLYPRDKQVLFKKLPQDYLKNVTIPVNNMVLNMTLEERYNYDFGDKTKRKLFANRKVLNTLKTKYAFETGHQEILKRKVKDVITDYINSSMYIADLRKIKLNEGEDYARNFDIIVRGNKNTLGYIDYFLSTPGNKTSKK